MPSKSTKGQDSGSLNSSEDSEESSRDIQVTQGTKQAMKKSTFGSSNKNKSSSTLVLSDDSDDELPDAAFGSPTPTNESNKKRKQSNIGSKQKKTKDATRNSPTASEPDKGPTQTAFELLADGKPRQQALVAMCYPRWILDKTLLEEAKEKRNYNLCRTALADEVNRRHALANEGQSKKCSSYKIPKLKDLLTNEYPITNECCIAFLEGEFEKVKKMLTNKVEDAQRERELNSTSADAWVGMHCWLMLFEVIVHGDVIGLYKESGKWSERLEIDARNSDEKPPEWQEVAAQLYNNPDFEPPTKVYPDLHPDFENPIKITRKDLPNVTPAKVKEQTMKARSQMLKLISNWENSGNGSGQKRENGDEDFGHIDNPEEQFIEGDNRKSFLETLNFKSYVLYGWQVFDEKDILNTTLARLKNDGDIAHGISKTNTSAKQTPKSVTDAAALSDMGRGVLSISKTLEDKQELAVFREMRGIRREMAATEDEEVKKELKAEYEALMAKFARKK